jgi:VIT1/CCC1 family predicted Fe2+/Mn2+ transporter
MVIKKKDTLDQHKAKHTPEAVARRISKTSSGSNYLKDFIYGSIDGVVTTFAVVSGVAGAKLSAHIIVILGVANLFGDGFSMAVGNFLGTKAEKQLRDKAIASEKRHIELYPDGEKQEIRQIYKDKGFEGEQLEEVVKVITSNKERWVETMVIEELGFPIRIHSPMLAAISTFFAFCAIGFLPLLPFLFNTSVVDAFFWSSILTASAFFTVGALKSKFVDTNWLTSGLETLAVGGIAAGLAYYAGYLLKDFSF